MLDLCYIKTSIYFTIFISFLYHLITIDHPFTIFSISFCILILPVVLIPWIRSAKVTTGCFIISFSIFLFGLENWMILMKFLIFTLFLGIILLQKGHQYDPNKLFLLVCLGAIIRFADIKNWICFSVGLILVELKHKKKTSLFPSDYFQGLLFLIGMFFTLTFQRNFLVLGIMCLFVIRELTWRGLGKYSSWKNWTIFHPNLKNKFFFSKDEIDWNRIFKERFICESNWKFPKRPLDFLVSPNPAIARFNSSHLFVPNGHVISSWNLHTGKLNHNYKYRNFGEVSYFDVNDEYLISGYSK